MNNSIHATWLGHATFKVETPEGLTVLIDPWVMGNPACPESAKKFDKIDVMLCTHGHFDHIGDAVALAKQYKPKKVVGIFELCAWLEKKGVANTAPMNKGGTQPVEGMEVTMVNANHSCGIKEDDGSIIYGGEAAGYVVKFSNGVRLYHSGDTNVFGDMAIIRDLYAPDIAMLPIGDHFTMGPREAEYAFNLLRPKVVIPMHFGTFPLLTGKPSDLQKAAQKLGIHLMELKPGERTEIHAAERVSQ